MTTFLIVSFGALALIVTGLLYWGRRRHGPARDNEKAAADDALRKLYGQYWAEVRAATQTHLLGAPADEEWLARIQERAVYASVAEETTGKSARKSPQRAALLLGWLLAAPGFLLGAAVAFYLAHQTAVVIYLVLAIFLGGVTLGVVMMVGMAVRREDRLYSLPGPPPAWSARGARRLTGIGWRDTDRPPALEGSDERPRSSPSCGP